MPKPGSTSYSDALWIVIERLPEALAADPNELRQLVARWSAEDARSAQLATELLAHDPALICDAAHESRYHAVGVARHVVAGVESLFHMKASAPHLVLAATAAITVSLESRAPAETLSFAWRLQGDALRLAGDCTRANEALAAADAHARMTTNRDYHTALVRYSRAILHLELDQSSRAASYLDGLAAIFVMNADAMRAANTLELEAWLFYRRCAWTEAAAKYREALAAQPDAMREVRITNNAGRCYAAMGDRESAAPLLRHAQMLAIQAGDRETEAHACRTLAELQSDRGGLVRALVIYDEIGYVGESLRVELELIRCDLADGCPCDALVARCRGVALRACGCGLTDSTMRELVALETLARTSSLTADIVTVAKTHIPTGARAAREVFTN